VNPYHVLDIPEFSKVDPVALHKAYKAAARKAHPDRNGGDTAKMAEINQARDILLNPERKKRFDEHGSTASGPLTTQEAAQALLANMFASAVESVSEDMSVMHVFACISKNVAEGLVKVKAKQKSHPAKAKRMRKILASITCDPILRSALELKCAKLDLELAEINQQVQVGETMLQLLKSVKFNYGY
jgi:curved DNA-binding protein CbpA